MLALTAGLVLSLLHPATPVTAAALAQQKVQIIKGKKGTGTVKSSPEAAPASAADANESAAREQALGRKAAELDARSRDLAEREQALAEKQAAHEEQEKKQAEQKAKQLRTIEKLADENRRALQHATDALAGD